jgi:ABC-type Mn2+/Zn2+ transport system ATPase subunit
MPLLEKLAELAQQGEGKLFIGPEEGQDLAAFQATVQLLRDYKRSGYLIIVSEHQNSRSGDRYIDKVHVRLTESGVAHWGNKEIGQTDF